MSYQVQYDFEDSIFYLFIRKHYCPNCRNKLKVKYRSNVINSDEKSIMSSEFKMGKYYFSGDKIIKTPIFHCEKCSSDFLISEIKQIEIIISKHR